jgi:hypothetical protein
VKVSESQEELILNLKIKHEEHRMRKRIKAFIKDYKMDTLRGFDEVNIEAIET